ncbi:MAG: DNA-formamidopyrimidine glycosylase family protein [Chitinophagaceae bacterium]
MPEGPSIMHLRNQLLSFKGKVVKNAVGYGPMPTAWINGKKLLDVLTWGKHLLFVFSNGTVRVHLMLFGEIRINERRKVNRSFFLEFAKGEINGYVVKAEQLKAPADEVYDWRIDIMDSRFDAAHVKTLIKKQDKKTIDDVLMDQQIFSGVGNKIRNEALYLAGIHPSSIIGKIPAAKITKLIKQVVTYARLFYGNLEKTGVHKSFGVYKQEFAADGSEVTMQILPKSKRKIYFSEHKQVLYE